MAKLGLIVPYRNRPDQLEQFIPYMKSYFSEHEIHDYEIIIVEQAEGKDFNRGALLNIGFLEALRLDCDYVSFHDLDMLPVRADYSYSDRVSQLAQEFLPKSARRSIPYDYFGGVTLFPVDIFRNINGYSNEYWGWGYEDNDLLLRCQESGVCLAEQWFDQPRTAGKAIKFNGKDSYIELDNPFNFRSSTLIYVDFIIDDLPVDIKRGHDEASIFSIPGLDITLAYDSFGTYKFEVFDNYEDVYSIHTDKMPKMHCQVIVFYDHRKNEIRFYLNNNLVGVKPIQKGRRIKVASEKLYLGMGNPYRPKSRKAFQGKIITFIGKSRSDSDELEQILRVGFSEIKPQDVDLWYDLRDAQVGVLVTEEGIELDTIKDSSEHQDAVAVNCHLVTVPPSSRFREPAPFYRKGVYKLLPHPGNGASDGHWQSWSTRLNQKRYWEKVQEGTDKKVDGLNSIRKIFKWELTHKEDRVKIVKTEYK